DVRAAVRVGHDPRAVPSFTSTAPRARFGLVPCGANVEKQNDTSDPLAQNCGRRERPEEKPEEGGRHGGKADSGCQIGLSISAHFQAIVAYAALAITGPGNRLPRSQALYLSPDRGAHRSPGIGPQQARGPARRDSW